MLAIAGVHTFGRIADVEVLVQLEARNGFQHRNAVFLGAAGIDRGFEDHQIAALQHRTGDAAGREQVSQIRALELVDRGRNRNDHDIAVFQIDRAGGVAEVRSALQFFLRSLKRVIHTLAQAFNPALADIETGDRKALPELYREREAYIAKTDDPDPR